MRHLVDQETAIQDIVQEYLQGGTTLIEALEKHWANDISRSQQELDKVKSLLAREFEEAIDWIVQERKEARESSIASVAKEHKAQQQILDQMMKEAMQSVGG